MPKATTGCSLDPISECYIDVPGFGKIVMDNLPDISDGKSASYTPTTIIGRSTPLTTYSHSDTRNISWGMHLFVKSAVDISGNLEILRVLESCVYPRNTAGPGPYSPPVICRIKCGDLLSINAPLCAVLKSYSVKFPTDVAWHDALYTPYKIDIDLSFEVVYNSSDLPGADRIVSSGG